MTDIFETITYGENQVQQYTYAFSSNSSTFREFKDGMSLIKWYYAYQKLNGKEFDLKGTSRMHFIADVFLSELNVSSIVESVLELDLSNSQKATLIDFYYLSSARVTSLLRFIDELGSKHNNQSEERLVIDQEKKLVINSQATQQPLQLPIGNVGWLLVNQG